MSLNWVFAIGAVAIWIVASLLYLRPQITRKIVAWREQRAAARAARTKE